MAGSIPKRAASFSWLNLVDFTMQSVMGCMTGMCWRWHGSSPAAAATWTSAYQSGPDLCMMEPAAGTYELTVTTLRAGVTREQVMNSTGWPVKFADHLEIIARAKKITLTALRDPQWRTLIAHGMANAE